MSRQASGNRSRKHETGSRDEQDFLILLILFALSKKKEAASRVR
jgi:hypothetical protein